MSRQLHSAPATAAMAIILSAAGFLVVAISNVGFWLFTRV